MVSDYLSKSERFACMKAGALSYAGMLDAEDAVQEKTAGAMDTLQAGTNAAKAMLVVAALGAGVPVGVFSHVMGRRIAGKRLREEELKEKIRIYRTAADELASGLATEESNAVRA